MHSHTAPGPRSGHRELAADHLLRAVARLRGNETARQALTRIAAERPECVEPVCVVDAEERLVGALPIARLLAADGDARMVELMVADYPRVAAEDDQEAAASLALHRAVDGLPVVDREGRLLGVMPVQALLQVLRREHIEDLHRLAGIQSETSQARHAIDDPPMRRVRHRLPWLLVGLVGSGLATLAMAGFEAALQANIALAFFVPAIVYLADAVGTQSEAIAVRGLSLTHFGLARLLLGELRTGMIIGATLGLIAFGPVYAAFGELRLAGAIAIAIFAASSIAASLGILLPWLLSRLRLDPAYGSGPVATVIQDILTILVYFGVVSGFGIG
jgi:magnesium transporter